MISPRKKGIPKRRAVLLGLFALLLAVLALTRFYTDILWFNEVGISSVLWTSLRTQFGVGAAVGVFTAFVVWLNLVIAGKLAPAYPGPRLEAGGREDELRKFREAITPYLRWIKLGVAAAVGLLAGLAASATWQVYLLWANRGPFGVSDPQFGKDVGFYVFELPFYDQVSGWVWFAILAALFTSLAAHYLFGAIQPELGLRGVLPGALAHVSVLLGLLALVKSFQYYLGTYQLNFSERGTVTGASYTDVNAQLPALRLLVIISIISALLFIANIFVRKLSLPLAAIGIWVLVAFLGGTVWPFAVQRFSVEPQEPQRERPFIERNLAATREAFGLAEVESQDYAATADLTAVDVAANQEVLQNVRLWDPGILESAYTQLQAIRTYYQFTDVDIDRYEIDGEIRQVLLSARELALEDLPEQSKNWQNLHLQYTHGFGLVASLANSSTEAGQPDFLVRDVPGDFVPGAEALDPEQPRIYYGEGFRSDEYSVVNSKQEELDFALEGEGVQRSSYEGEGGIPVGSLLRRLAFAVREGDPNLVLTGLISGESRILIYRDVRDRVLRAAPFLDLDNDPYLTVIDGRLVWIIDAYTSSPWYPYSQRFDATAFVPQGEAGALSGNVNYVRNSVKVTIDAYDGNMDFHIVDDEDPMIAAWQKAFPALFTAEEPSEDLMAHFRYPEDIFKLQSEVYRTYHMEDPLDFYSKEDAWDVPSNPTVGDFQSTQDSDSLIPPVYLLFRIPGEDDQEFVLTRPFTPRGRDVMISTLVARSDPANYGELISLEFPPSRTVLGPQQVENLINQDVEVSRTLTLLGQRGSSVAFGSMVILPIDQSLLYVQPLFVTAENVGIPELKKIAMVQGEDVVLSDSFDEALVDLFGVDDTPEPPLPIDPGEESDPSDDEPPPIDPEGRLARLIERAGNLYDEAQEALADGDFARYGELIEELGRVLTRAQAAR
jgi:uncharacterized membrane protein (UPF0182 family)